MIQRNDKWFLHTVQTNPHPVLSSVSRDCTADVDQTASLCCRVDQSQLHRGGAKHTPGQPITVTIILNSHEEVMKLIKLSTRSSAHQQDYTHTHTHPFNGPFSRTTRVSRYQKGKTNLDFTEARDSEWQWHQRGHMQVCISLQTDNHASTPPFVFLQARCRACCPTNSIKALKAKSAGLHNS